MAETARAEQNGTKQKVRTGMRMGAVIRGMTKACWKR